MEEVKQLLQGYKASKWYTPDGAKLYVIPTLQAQLLFHTASHSISEEKSVPYIKIIFITLIHGYMYQKTTPFDE